MPSIQTDDYSKNKHNSTIIKYNITSTDRILYLSILEQFRHIKQR